MRQSQGRIPVTHQGTLPRDERLTEMIAAREEGRPAPQDLDRRIRSAVEDRVERQLELGFDLVNDGEQSKSGFSYYVRCRLSGCEERSVDPGSGPPPRDTAARDRLQFPGFFAAQRPGPFRRRQFFVTGPIRYVGQEIVQADIRNLTAALASRGAAAEGVLMAVAPGTVEHWMHNEHYPDEESFLYALADALHEEYRAITDAGLVVQIDDPDLADGWQVHPEMTVDEYRRYAGVRVDALNHALRDVPSEQVILHVCWGSFHTPHVNDLPLSDLLDLMLRVRARGLSIEQSNPRHDHEWQVFEEVGLPEDRILIPGVVGHVTDLVEHPELIAQRLVRYARAVGPERVMAGTDCGIGSRVSHPEVAWAKLAALSEGARLASDRLQGERPAAAKQPRGGTG